MRPGWTSHQLPEASNPVNADQRLVLEDLLLAMADDELILGHRNSEWCGHAPILEEDIAFANLALDEIGHAGFWYTILAELRSEDPGTYPDDLVYFRDIQDYRCAQLVELPKGDWAFSILRQYLFDSAEMVRLEALTDNAYRPVAEAAVKIRKEEMYHYRHSQAWMRRLGLGTQESGRRLQNALEQAWPYTQQLFLSLPDNPALFEDRVIPNPQEMMATWDERVVPFLVECALQIPHENRKEISRSQHTPHLNVLLSEMQAVARSEPEAEW
jgi:ring-1,2-phenylacetyl-CoA epoxidase subunit PaaC